MVTGAHRAAPPVLSGGLPLLGHTAAFVRDPVPVLWRGHAEHGTAFSLRLAGRRTVVLLGREHSRTFFAETDERLSIASAYPFFVRMFDPDFFYFGGQKEYLRQRDLILPRFRGNQFDAYVAVMEQRTRALIDQLGDEGETDLVTTLGPLVMNIAAHAFLGPDITTRIDGFFSLFRDFSSGMDPVLPGWLPLPRVVRGRRARARLRSEMLALVAERRRRPADPPDFLQALSEAHYPDGRPAPDRVIVNLILLLTWAGHETTTGHLAWALTDLLGHPHECERVRAEQEAVLAPDEPLTSAAVRRLAHLSRALHETERLHPVAYIMARRTTAPLTTGGFTIPADTLVLLSPALSHRLPEDHPDPDSFRPDRFLEEPRRLHDLTGFGGGVHRCLGVHFAYVEMQVVVTLLLRHYDLELIDRPEPVRGTRTKWPQSPCRIRYKARAGRAAARREPV
ncbi:cytochrome P450 [Streptomyces sp. LP05-1]|uniref:Cytochrome P450 n=1 Tax=Streptomyces pyxinae TaxID=2970734 RepID=A0ABT2CKW8_9ACTN|nr:cytochrome P450 [Streptomyces sp. LP05-1]MCS0638047.1 cytochrome P450 [Streptomyces sp. LP05-1]